MFLFLGDATNTVPSDSNVIGPWHAWTKISRLRLNRLLTSFCVTNYTFLAGFATSYTYSRTYSTLRQSNSSLAQLSSFFFVTFRYSVRFSTLLSHVCLIFYTFVPLSHVRYNKTTFFICSFIFLYIYTKAQWGGVHLGLRRIWPLAKPLQVVSSHKVWKAFCLGWPAKVWKPSKTKNHKNTK